jgi:hypothetical protein
MHRQQRCLREALEEISVEHPVSNLTLHKATSLGTFTNTEEMWTWMGRGLLTALNAGSRPGFIRTFNQAVGHLQLRQKRMRLANCDIDSGLDSYYRAGCREGVSDAVFGPAADPANANNKDPAFLAGGLMPGSGINAERFYAWLDVSTPAESMRRVEELWAAGWVDDATLEVEARLAIFNPEVRSFTLLTVRIFFFEGGLLGQSHEVQPLSANVYPHMAYILVDVVWALIMVGFLFVCLQEVSDRRARNRSCSKSCCGDAWLLLDWASIFFGFTLVTFFLLYFAGLNDFSAKVSELAGMKDSTASRVYEGHVALLLDHLDWLIMIKTYDRLFMFWYSMLILVRFFRGFLGQPRIAAIGRTIGAAGADLLHFGIIFLVVFENFALGGYVLFGIKMQDWSTFRYAQRSTLAMLFGRGDFASMYNIAPVSAFVWLFTFVLAVAFILANMLIAIITDHHGEFQHASGQADQHFLWQMYATLGDIVWHVAYEVRVVRRFLARKTNLAQSVRRLLDTKDEPIRVSRVPFDALLDAVGGVDYQNQASVEQTLLQAQDTTKPHSWAPVREDFIRRCGLDAATAGRLMRKCRQRTAGKRPHEFPMDQLFHEYEVTMQDSYKELSILGEEIKGWLSQRLVDCRNLEPHQRKLLGLVGDIRPAEVGENGGFPFGEPMLADPDQYFDMAADHEGGDERAEGGNWDD